MTQNARTCNARTSRFFLCFLRGLLFLFHGSHHWPNARREGTGGNGGSRETAVDGHFRVIRVFRGYLAAGVPVGKYLADQLLLPLGIGAHFGSGGGNFRTMALSRHATTHLDMLHCFLDIDATIEQAGRDDIVVRIG